MAKKIQEGRRVMSMLDPSISSEVRNVRGPAEAQLLDFFFCCDCDKPIRMLSCLFVLGANI
jgi:hypothetical protein